MAWFSSLASVLLLCAASAAPSRGETPVGLVASSDRATPGFTLVAPMRSHTTYLVDLSGCIVRRWECPGSTNLTAYLLENGHLLRAGSFGMIGNVPFRGGGAGGVVEEYDWEGNLLWRFKRADADSLLHHDIEPLPNGNVLMIVWERKTREEAVAAGRDPNLADERGLWSDCIIEVKPTPPEGGTIVWEWHVWDHLVQEADPAKANYGKVDRNPSRINVNPPGWVAALSGEQREQLEALGYLAGAGPREARASHPDWTHVNSVDYSPELDQVCLSVLNFNELWIIDHSTTREQAAGATGGRYGKGGDLLYRWGNPAAYGTEQGKQTLFAQHDVQWVSNERLLLFNNGRGRPDGNYSSVDEVLLPIDDSGAYATNDAGGFAAARLLWTYAAPEKRTLFSPVVSGAQRLPSGNTLVCSGSQGRVFEVSQRGEVLWDCVLAGPAMGFPGPGDLDPDSVFDRFDEDGNNQLSREEFKNLTESMPPPMFPPFGAGPGGPRGPGRRGRGQPPSPTRMDSPPFRAGPPPADSGHRRRPGGPGGDQLFRALRYAPEYPAFQGRKMRPGPLLEEELADSAPMSRGGRGPQ